jgi:hypothetical protein
MPRQTYCSKDRALNYWAAQASSAATRRSSVPTNKRVCAKARARWFAILSAAAFASPSFAYTECTASPMNVYVGDSGVLWLVCTTAAGFGRAYSLIGVWLIK